MTLRESLSFIYPRLYWDLVMMIILVLNIIILPVDMAFFSNEYRKSWRSFHIISDMSYLIDMLLNFRTGYRATTDASEFELAPRKIALQ